MSRHVLVVDDEKNIRAMLKAMLEMAGYEVECIQSGEEALARCREGAVDLVLLDVRLPGMDGLSVLRALREDSPQLPVVMMSGHGTIETAVEAVRGGAFDFLEKPLTRDKTLLTLESVFRRGELERENERLRQKAAQDEILGDSPLMDELREKIARVAPTVARVLIEGESGTGKELVARAIHRESSRSRRSFLALNCAAVPGELIESELFGHVRGAFTGATTARAGIFEEADGGTLFLDEIGDMPLSMQAKLLRVLESSRFSRVGSARERVVDVRVIAATHRDLGKQVSQQRFREDLFHRLNVIPLRVPALRDRAEDIPLLARYFLQTERAAQKLGPRSFTAAALRALQRYGWPGNVRELRNLVERLVILCRADRIGEEDIFQALPLTSSPPEVASLRSAVEEAQRKAITAALRACGGNVSEAARRLQLERSHLYKKAKSLGVSLKDEDS